MPPNMDAIASFFKDGEYNITIHGYEELDSDSITIENLELAIGQDEPEIIEDYPNDPRGASCLILSWCQPNIPIHVCVSISGDRPEVITAYRPNPLLFWPPYFQKRR